MRVRLRYLPHYDGRIEVFSTEECGAVTWAAPISRRRRRWSSVVR
nr:hypothetical protein OG409_00005 [Streptomyces sp. NBC_00974]